MISKATRTRRRNAAKRARMAAERAKDPQWRLIEAGSGSSEAIRRRLLWLAYERGLPVEAVPGVGRNMTCDVAEFCRDHKIDFTWALGGDLDRLREVIRGPDRDREAAAAFLAQLSKLNPRSLKMIRAAMGPT